MQNDPDYKQINHNTLERQNFRDHFALTRVFAKIAFTQHCQHQGSKMILP